MLIGYILVKGIPNLHPSLFAWNYNTENVSMMPALINTILMVLLSLVIAAPIGIFSAIYLVEYAKRGNKLVELIRLTTETFAGHSFYRVRSVRRAVFCQGTGLEFVSFSRRIHAGHYDFAADYAYYRGSAEGGAG